MNGGARRNLRLYPWYLGGVSFFAWMPVFFLYFSQRVSLGEVLLLEAIYYVSVALLEVPSGYVSDRLGRRLTMRLAALGLVGGYIAFVTATSFGGLAVGQIFLAAALAFHSGTDTSFHLANLEALGEAESYGDREAGLATMVFVVGACSAVIGGAVSLLDMRLAYGLSLMASLMALGVAFLFRPVEVERESESSGGLSFGETLRRCVVTARDRRLGWYFLVVVVATVINHLPYEFYQPYLEALKSQAWAAETTPLVAGVHMALAQFVAAPIAAMSVMWARRLGTVRLVLISLALQIALIGAMALWTSPIVAILLITRSVPGALQKSPVREAVTPYVARELRATYLSLQSLMGRLGFAVVLVGLSQVSDELFTVLRVALVVAVVLWLVVVGSAGRGRAVVDDGCM